MTEMPPVTLGLLFLAGFAGGFRCRGGVRVLRQHVRRACGERPELGARLGSGLVIRKGAGLIRPVFLTVVFAMTAKLGWDAWRG